MRELLHAASRDVEELSQCVAASAATKHRAFARSLVKLGDQLLKLSVLWAEPKDQWADDQRIALHSMLAKELRGLCDAMHEVECCVAELLSPDAVEWLPGVKPGRGKNKDKDYA